MTKINKKITVVMAVYKNDNSTYFDEAIKSLLNQSLIPEEIIIVVDGHVNSDIDNFLEKYLENNRFVILRLKTNQGLANALNLAIKSSSNSIIARMDADDICTPNRFEIQLNYLIENNLSIVGGQMFEFGKSIDDVISIRSVPLFHKDIIKFMKFRNPISHPTVIFEKKVADVLNGYDTNVFPEDYDFFVRAYLNGFKFGNVKEKVLWFRMGENKSFTLKRRWGINYAKKEFKLYSKFYRIGFFNFYHLIQLIISRLPLRILPFFIFKFLYFRFSRVKKY